MSAEEFAGLGFAPGVIRGVRSFNVDKFGRLTGIHYKQVWLPGENAAECRRDGDDPYVRMVTALLSRPMTSYTDGYLYGRRGRGKSSTIPPTPVAPLQHSFETCACGFYGYFDGSDDYHDNARITAVVEGYGETLIGTRGFRAMKARIVAIRVKADDDGITGHIARKVTNNYKGVAVFDSFEAMTAEFPPDMSFEPSPDTDPDFWKRAI